jgi:subfamily B ATP-binding cassette protein MsbA
MSSEGSHTPRERDGAALERAGDVARAFPMMKRVFRDHVWPYRRRLFYAIGAMAANSAMTGLIPLMMRDSADKIFIAHEQLYLYLLPPAIVVLMLLRSGADYVGKISQAHLANRFVADLRIRLFEKLTTADLAWLQSMNSGRFVTAFMSDVGAVNAIASQTVAALVQNGLQVIVLVCTMFYLDWRLSLFVVSVLPIGIWLTRVQRKRARGFIRAMMTEVGSLGTIVTEMLAAVRVVKAYHQEGSESARARKTIERALHLNMKTVRARAMTGPIAEGLGGIGIGAAIFYGGWQGVNGHLTLGEFMGFISAAMLSYQPFKALAGSMNQIQEGTIAAGRVFSILDQQDQISELPGAQPLSVASGAIRFEGVHFTYDGENDVLSDVTLDIPAGCRVALVGPSGAGKSTIINLVLRFYDPRQGRILIDGQDIRQATLGSVRLASALLTQEPVLFDDTIRANIGYGSPKASVEEIEDAARRAAAHGFITSLPKGYDTEVGQSGQFLSGGQRQRIAFARAMLRDAPILLLDEPTSALDAESEAIIQEGLDRLARNKTVIIIAHRLVTIRNADIIVAMEKGRIVEVGPHDELLALNGLYARLFHTQFATQAEKTEAVP